MGVGQIALTLYANLAKSGLLKPGQFMFELGSQEVFVKGWEYLLPAFYKALGKSEITETKWGSARDLMCALGFNYQSADLDGRFGALPFDFNKPWVSHHQYDVVTNHGTTEHCFDQNECFRTVHAATDKGGLMIHCVPTQGYRGHCFYLYQPQFFQALADANKYEVISLQVAHDTYNKPTGRVELCKVDAVLPGNVLLCAVLRKTEYAPFNVPIQELYRI
jgi:hypothetical protein